MPQPHDADKLLTTLRDLMQGSESDTARIAAAKILLECLSPKQDDEAQKHEAEEYGRFVGAGIACGICLSQTCSLS